MSRRSLFELTTQDPVELNSIVLKSKLASLLRILIKNEGWSQTAVAEKLQTTQSRVSNLLAGHVSKFSLDFLLNSLFRLGYKTDLDYNPADDDQPLTIAIKKAVL